MPGQVTLQHNIMIKATDSKYQSYMTTFVHHDMQSINSDKDGQIVKLQNPESTYVCTYHRDGQNDHGSTKEKLECVIASSKRNRYCD